MAVVESCVKSCCRCFDGATVLKYTVIFIIFILPIVICAALGITMITVAAIYIDDCPYEKMVPIWLIVGAIIPFALLLFMIIAARDKSKSILSWRRILAYIVLAVFFSWLIAGSVWILNTWTYAKTWCSDENCCQQTVMNTAIVMLMIHWCFFALALLILIYIFIKIACFNKK